MDAAYSLVRLFASMAMACALELLVAHAPASGAEAEKPAALYRESLRPQVHFTAQANWINDPNGLVFFRDEYHLFFQHDPTKLNGSEFKSWGHAVSSDLVHWRQMNDALLPDELGSIWSGSAVVDWHNTAGLQAGDEPPLVAMYTAAGGMLPASAGRPFTQALAYSNDRGRSWYKYAGNPVLANVANGNRDPKVVWHAPTKRWVTALYLSDDRFGLFASPDLKEWRQLQEVRVSGSSECPDFFEAPIEGEAGATRWIFWTANNAYLAGAFDGTKFVAEGGPRRGDFGDCYYAAQTFSDIPAKDGRRIQIAWMRGGQYPDMPFNQQLSIPTVLTLRRDVEGLRLLRSPVKELEKLRGDRGEWKGTLGEGRDPFKDVSGDAFEIRATIDSAAAREMTLCVHGTPLTYDVAAGRLSLPGAQADIPLHEGKLRLHAFVDRTSVEVFAAEGRATLAKCFVPAKGAASLSLSGDGAIVESLEWWTLKSIWDQASK
jgi:sucrose-6-phosphate hydrolase SacC (GH32 family)